MLARVPQIRIIHKEPPAGTSNSPIFGQIARLSGKYQGTRNIPSYDLLQLGREHKVTIKVSDNGRVSFVPLSMISFYEKHGFEKKIICGKECFVPPSGVWTVGLMREAIRYCVETVLGKGDAPHTCTGIEFREYLRGVFAHFNQNKQKMLEFAGYNLE